MRLFDKGEDIKNTIFNNITVNQIFYHMTYLDKNWMYSITEYNFLPKTHFFISDAFLFLKKKKKKTVLIRLLGTI